MFLTQPSKLKCTLALQMDVQKQERRRWFPADTEADCEEEPGAEQVSVRVTMMSCDVTLCIIR